MKFILPYFEYFRGNAESLLLSFSVRTKEVLLPGKAGGGTAIYGLYLVCAAVKDMVFKLFTLGQGE